MKKSLAVTVVVFVFSLLTAGLGSQCCWGQNLDEQGRLPRATPESQGVDSNKIVALIQAFEQAGEPMNSLMILRHGNVIAEAYWTPFNADTPHAMYSMSKSFTSTAAGFAADEGLLDIDTPVMDFFPDDLPANPSDNFKAMKVRHLLSMSCGHKTEPEIKGIVDFCRDPHDTLGSDENWVQIFLNHPVPFEPGTHFTYNTAGTYMVAAVLNKVTNESLVEYLKPRLFDPLRIENFFWEVSPQGINKGGTGLYIKTEDMAKFGQFYLQKGKWNGQQLLSEKWIAEATSKQVANGSDPDSDWSQGYCFQFWRCRNNIYRGDGMYSQFVVVIPEKDMVIASTANSGNYQGILNRYWEYLLPAAGDSPLPENDDTQRTLAQTIAKLTLIEGVSSNEVRRDLTLESPSLKQTLRYSVYLPRGCRTIGRDYPVLVLLPTGGKSAPYFASDQVNLGEVADAWFKSHQEAKCIIVVPDLPDNLEVTASGATDLRWLSEELLPHLASAWQCDPNKLTLAALPEDANVEQCFLARGSDLSKVTLPSFLSPAEQTPNWATHKSNLPQLFEFVLGQ
ncbi:MAG: serine hydrolase [Planctomycetia bacterium]|nr:serine hydrolase [Planctomycetia bacterium]